MNTQVKSLFRLIFLCGASALSAGGEAAERPPPNIVIILADDLGYGDVGCYGATRVKTPNIDRLANEGMRFIDAHSPASVCTPSRYNLLTGRYSWRTYAGTGAVWDDPLMIETSRPTLPSMLKARGYATGIVGKWHLGLGAAPENPRDWRGADWNGEIKPGPLEVGFDYAFFRPAMNGPVPQVYIDGHRVVGLDPADPIVAHMFTPGRPGYDAVPRNGRNLGLPPTGGKSAQYKFDQTGEVETAKVTAFIEAHAARPFFLYFAAHNVHGPITPGKRFAGKNSLGGIGDFIEELDGMVGEIMETLEAKGIADNTMVIFTSDNGGTGGGNSAAHRRNGPLRGRKTDAYEGGHRVPLIVRWPGRVAAGASTGALVGLNDIVATVAELVGYPLPDDAAEDSETFLNVLFDAAQPARRSIVCDGWKGDYSIRDGRWKLILPAPDFPDVRPGPELFDLEADLGEQNNVAAQHPELVRRLTAELEKIKQDGRSRTKTERKNK